MGKRWRKLKAGHQEPKRRKPQGAGGGGGGGGGSSGSSGTLSGMRTGLKWLVGAGPRPQTLVGKILDAALWIAVVVVAYVVIQNQCSR